MAAGLRRVTLTGMSADTSSGSTEGPGDSRPEEAPAATWRARLRQVGPGVMAAATGVGAGDLVATMVAGARYGYALFWAVVIGCVMKVVLVEGAGRYSLASGHTIYEGWSSLGSWTAVYFGPYIVIWGFVYGAAAMAGTGLPLANLFPVFSTTTWGILSGLIGLALVWMGRYSLFEKVCALFVGLMLFGLIWLLVFQLAATNPVDAPDMLQWMADLGPWNYAIAFAFMITGLLLTMRWR